VGPRGPEYRRDDTTTPATVRWYVYDGLGSVLEEVDPSGNVDAYRKYDVYGSVRGSTGTGTSKHEFVGAMGHPSEAETGLIYMRARYMDPAVGRFLCEDPSGNGWNWYTYANDSPTGRADPDGRSSMLLESIGAELMAIGAMLLIDAGWGSGAVLRSAWGRFMFQVGRVEGAIGTSLTMWRSASAAGAADMALLLMAVTSVVNTLRSAIAQAAVVAAFPFCLRVAEAVVGFAAAAEGAMVWIEAS
jgi:RHS repeat-associated protein